MQILSVNTYVFIPFDLVWGTVNMWSALAKLDQINLLDQHEIDLCCNERFRPKHIHVFEWRSQSTGLNSGCFHAW